MPFFLCVSVCYIALWTMACPGSVTLSHWAVLNVSHSIYCVFIFVFVLVSSLHFSAKAWLTWKMCSWACMKTLTLMRTLTCPVPCHAPTEGEAAAWWPFMTSLIDLKPTHIQEYILRNINTFSKEKWLKKLIIICISSILCIVYCFSLCFIKDNTSTQYLLMSFLLFCTFIF